MSFSHHSPLLQGYIGHDPINQLIIISFRGTDTALLNYVVDGSAKLVDAPSLTPGKVAASQSPRLSIT